jgi:hypothetical protein
MTYTYTVGNSTITNGGGLSGSSGTITLSNLTGSTYTLASGAGSSGQVYTTNGTSTLNWATPNQSQFNGGNGKPVMTMPHGKDEVVLEKDATLTVKGNVIINGVDLEERLNTIEKVLQIPERDVKLEKKHPKLKKLYDEYIHSLAKYRTFEAIKGDDDGTT